MKTYSGAIIDLMKEARSQNCSVTGYKRVLRACKTFSLDEKATNEVCQYLEYHNREGQPYEWLRKKL